MKAIVTTTIAVKKTFCLIEVVYTLEITSITLLQKEHMDCNLCDLFQLLSLTSREQWFRMPSKLDFFIIPLLLYFLPPPKCFSSESEGTLQQHATLHV